MMDVISLGEVLVDLTQTGEKDGIASFAAFPGGAPANVAVAASRLGAKAGFIGKVGRDSFGRDLRKTLDREGVDTSFLYETDESPTTLAIVHVDESGERSFAFYRQPGADTRLTADEAVRFLESDVPKILHFGSLSLTDEPSRTAAMSALARAREAGVLISYDPNYRPALWSSESLAIERMKEPLDQVDILKVSDDEMIMLTGTDDFREGSRILQDYGISLVFVTLGGDGVFFRWGQTCGTVAGVTVTVSDTNGAGDTFLGAMLSRIAELIGGEADKSRLSRMDEDTLREFLAYANRAAAITCSRPGAIPAMPTRAEMEAVI